MTTKLPIISLFWTRIDFVLLLRRFDCPLCPALFLFGDLPTLGFTKDHDHGPNMVFLSKHLPLPGVACFLGNFLCLALLF